jgi:hypothetical protein
MFYNVLTTSINNTRKPFAVPKQFHREYSEARPILQTLGIIYVIYRALRLVTQSSESAQYSAGSTFTFFKPANFMAPYAFTRYQGNAMEHPFSISALGSVYDVAQKNI